MIWGNDKGAAQNLFDYMSDMDTLISHLNAARSVAVGLYNHNPDSRKVPSLDDLEDQLQQMCFDLRLAKKSASDRLKEIP